MRFPAGFAKSARTCAVLGLLLICVAAAQQTTSFSTALPLRLTLQDALARARRNSVTYQALMSTTIVSAGYKVMNPINCSIKVDDPEFCGACLSRSRQASGPFVQQFNFLRDACLSVEAPSKGRFYTLILK